MRGLAKQIYLGSEGITTGQSERAAKYILEYNDITPKTGSAVTAKIAGLNLDRIRHLTTCRHVALIGTRKNGQMPLF